MNQKSCMLSLFSIIAVVALAVFLGCNIHHGQAQEGAIPQSGDLCGGTGGKGQIVSVGSDTFTMRRNDNGRNQIIHLTNQATIETSSGTVSIFDLKAGERVTLVGGPNPDGSFTAYMVVVCAGTVSATATGTIPLTVIAKNTDLKNFNAAIAISKTIFFGLIWLGIILFLWLKKKKSLVYLLFFTIFYIYLYVVLDYTLFQFQTLVFEKYFVSGLMLKGIATGKGLNLIPLITLTLKDIRTSFLNILLMLPFGFGLPFITNLRMKRVVIVGTLFSIGIESLQFITGYIGKMTFRIADVNDVIFNTVGVTIGYVLFIGFLRIYRHASRNWKIRANPILRYIAELPQTDK